MKSCSGGLAPLLGGGTLECFIVYNSFTQSFEGKETFITMYFQDLGRKSEATDDLSVLECPC